MQPLLKLTSECKWKALINHCVPFQGARCCHIALPHEAALTSCLQLENVTTSSFFIHSCVKALLSLVEARKCGLSKGWAVSFWWCVSACFLSVSVPIKTFEGKLNVLMLCMFKIPRTYFCSFCFTVTVSRKNRKHPKLLQDREAMSMTSHTHTHTHTHTI